MNEDEFRVLSPTAILGYGFPEESFRKGMARKPHLVAVDAGSTDPGPYYLGAGKSFTSRKAVRRDLEIIVEAAVDASIPVIIGSAGGSGALPHVEWTRSILEEIAAKKRLRFTSAVLHADISSHDVLAAFESKRLRSLSHSAAITREDIRSSTRIVAQMGAEPVWKALDTGSQVILCGRCYDPVPFAAPAIREGFDPGLAYHMGKILECAAIAATPGSGRDCVMGTLRRDGFELESLNEQRRFTRVSTAAHTLYEKSDPYRLPGPGGTLDLTDTKFEELDGGRVRVSGSRYVPDLPYTIKLEGVRLSGYRTICVAGVRDPAFICRIDAILESVERQVIEDLGIAGRILFHVYGVNGVMGAMEPEKDSIPHEMAVIIEAIAADEEDADALCAHARSTLLHCGYPGRISTAGNLALLYSPSDIPCGAVYEFSIYHLMEVEDPVQYFPLELCEVGR
jgi:hypothetical protein